jgi:hypothetical protein
MLSWRSCSRLAYWTTSACPERTVGEVRYRSRCPVRLTPRLVALVARALGFACEDGLTAGAFGHHRRENGSRRASRLAWTLALRHPHTCYASCAFGPAQARSWSAQR